MYPKRIWKDIDDRIEIENATKFEMWLESNPGRGNQDWYIYIDGSQQ